MCKLTMLNYWINFKNKSDEAIKVYDKINNII